MPKIVQLVAFCRHMKDRHTCLECRDELIEQLSLLVDVQKVHIEHLRIRLAEKMDQFFDLQEESEKEREK